MACYMCEICDELKDGDYIVPMEWGEGLACEDCHCENTPENFEDWIPRITGYSDSAFRWEITHKDYDGAPIHSLEGPAEHGFFYGPSLLDVWQQAMEYEDANT